MCFRLPQRVWKARYSTSFSFAFALLGWFFFFFLFFLLCRDVVGILFCSPVILVDVLRKPSFRDMCFCLVSIAASAIER